MCANATIICVKVPTRGIIRELKGRIDISRQLNARIGISCQLNARVGISRQLLAKGTA